jgi:acyl-CoA reductase-like NAD-dependent aldehyde dehydrogenase
VTGEALVATRDLDMVSFTGSTGVGMRIGEVGGRTMKRLLLELGGKGGALVYDDANLKTAIGMIGSTWTFHSGQICTAPTRAIVQRGVYDQVVEGLTKMANVLKVGPTRCSARSSPPRTATGSRATSKRVGPRAPKSSPEARARRSPTPVSTSRPRCSPAAGST